jgi:hypothetical protein
MEFVKVLMVFDFCKKLYFFWICVYIMFVLVTLDSLLQYVVPSIFTSLWLAYKFSQFILFLLLVQLFF